MPLDSLNKRSSCIGLDLMWLHVYPKPGTTKDINWRQQVGMKYAGTLTASTATGASGYRMLMGVGA